jgi:hypothetical protein
MLKWALNLLLAFLLYRVIRGWRRPRPAPGPRRPRDRGLDPERAVPARWSEVREERDGPG